MGEEKRLKVLEHLHELQQRLIKCVVAVVITTSISFVFAKQLFQILILPTQGISLVFIEMTEMVGTYIKVCLTSGVILALPYLMYQLLMFVAPALTPKEKRHVYLMLPWIGLMFAGGIAFGYFVLIPPATNFLISFGSDIAIPQIRIGNYISLVTRLLLAVGLIFELPVVIMFLSRLGVVTPKWLARKRRMAIIMAFLVAAIITPTFDPINQSLIAIPLIILYEMGIWLAKVVEPRKPVVATSKFRAGFGM